MSIKDTLFIITHPLAAAEARIRQAQVAIEVGGPPAGSTIEDFPELPVSEAAALINMAREAERGGGGVQLEDWSKADQERLKKGERPRGAPIHRNM